MTKYEALLSETEKLGIRVKEIDFGANIECGFYSNNKILINSNLLESQKSGILAEELGHHLTSFGDITDLSKTKNIKQEVVARNWAYEKLIGLSGLIQAYKDHIKGTYNLAEYFGVTEQFFKESIEYYKKKYGLYCEVDTYILCFEPLGILEKFVDF